MPGATPLAASLFQTPPPAELQWLALLLALLSLPAISLALPPFLEMKYGSPRLRLRFDERDVGDVHVLECHVLNPPISHPLLRRLGIHRREAEITAGVLIREYGTNRYITETIPIISLMGAGRSTTQRVTLRESLDPALIAIAAHEGSQTIFDPLGERIPLRPGEYWADVSINYGAEQVEGSRAFVVPTEGELYWRRG